MIFTFNHNASNESLIFQLADDGDPVPILADVTRLWLETVLNVLMFSLSVLGAITNAINIRVFIQQGLTSDSNTIGLFALAVADFLGCFILIPTTLCEISKYTASSATTASCVTLTSFVLNLPHVGMARVTCLLTVYIAVERCLCVLVPFKVKTLIRPRIVTIAIILMYVILMGVYIPLYTNIKMSWRFSDRFNTTVVIVSENYFAKVFAKYLSLIMNTVVSPLAILIVAVATGLMLYKLNKYKKWREKAVSVDNKSSANELKPSEAQGKKDNIEVLKMVVMVTGLFLVCLSMGYFPGFASAFVPGFSYTGINRNIYYIFYQYKFVFDLINSSMNFFFYIRISSRYKAAYNETFSKAV